MVRTHKLCWLLSSPARTSGRRLFYCMALLAAVFCSAILGLATFSTAQAAPLVDPMQASNLQASGVITGTVLASNSAPLATGYVTLCVVSETYCSTHASDETDASGGFEIYPYEPGTYKLYFEDSAGRHYGEFFHDQTENGCGAGLCRG